MLPQRRRQAMRQHGIPATCRHASSPSQTPNSPSRVPQQQVTQVWRHPHDCAAAAGRVQPHGQLVRGQGLPLGCKGRQGEEVRAGCGMPFLQNAGSWPAHAGSGPPTWLQECSRPAAPHSTAGQCMVACGPAMYGVGGSCLGRCPAKPTPPHPNPSFAPKPCRPTHLTPGHPSHTGPPAGLQDRPQRSSTRSPSCPGAAAAGRVPQQGRSRGRLARCRRRRRCQPTAAAGRRERCSQLACRPSGAEEDGHGSGQGMQDGSELQQGQQLLACVGRMTPTAAGLYDADCRPASWAYQGSPAHAAGAAPPKRRCRWSPHAAGSSRPELPACTVGQAARCGEPGCRVLEGRRKRMQREAAAHHGC